MDNNLIWRDKVTGTVIPIPTPFKEDLSVDYDSLEKYVDFLINLGIKNLLTTVGTSRYNLLSYEEVKLVNQTVVQASAQRATVIVSNATTGDTRQAIEFAQHAENSGADMFISYYPERFYGEDILFDFHYDVAKNINIPIILHEMPMRNGFGGAPVQYSIDLLERLLDIPNIVGMKEEALNPAYSKKILKKFGQNALIIGAGGGMSRYLVDYWYGAKAFLGGIGNFYPQLEIDFFEAMQEGNYNTAHKIVYEVEQPYFEKVVPMGWHPSLKAALALKGLLPKFERPPFPGVSEENTAILQTVLQENNW